jgi:hypothetical protein
MSFRCLVTSLALGARGRLTAREISCPRLEAVLFKNAITYDSEEGHLCLSNEA